MVQSIKNIIAAILIAISGFLFWTNIYPAYQLTSQLKTKISERELILVSKTEIIKSIEDIKDDYESRYSEMQRLLLVVPDKKSLPEIISTLEAVFFQTGNFIGDLTVADDFKEGETLRNIGLVISSTGNYDSVINLLSIVEKNIRLFDITGISISEDQNAAVEGQLNIQLNGNVYWLGMIEDGPPASSKTAPIRGGEE